jgi:hypothetical protein
MKEEKKKHKIKIMSSGYFKCAKISMLIGVVSFLQLIYVYKVEENASKNTRHICMWNCWDRKKREMLKWYRYTNSFSYVGTGICFQAFMSGTGGGSLLCFATM